MAVRKTTVSGYAPLNPALLQTDTVPEFDLYIWPEASSEPVLYRNRLLPFLAEHREHLSMLGTNAVFARVEEESAFARYVEKNLDKIISDPSITTREKAQALYQGSLQLTEDIFARPDSPENFKRSENVVQNTMGYILQGREAFHHLLSLTSYDYYTYTHSVDVCTLGLALAAESGMSSNDELMQFGVGALFHDVGKTRLDPRVLNKKGPLSDDEWVQMKRHPELGLEVIDPKAPFSDSSKSVILEHHERADGTGYPNGKKASAIHPFAKVAAIVDVFDALTTKRSYRNAVDTFQALTIMKGEVGTHFESQYFEQFVRLLGR